MSAVKATDFIKRSMIYRVLDSHGAVFESYRRQCDCQSFW